MNARGPVIILGAAAVGFYLYSTRVKETDRTQVEDELQENISDPTKQITVDKVDPQTGEEVPKTYVPGSADTNLGPNYIPKDQIPPEKSPAVDYTVLEGKLLPVIPTSAPDPVIQPPKFDPIIAAKTTYAAVKQIEDSDEYEEARDRVYKDVYVAPSMQLTVTPPQPPVVPPSDPYVQAYWAKVAAGKQD